MFSNVQRLPVRSSSTVRLPFLRPISRRLVAVEAAFADGVDPRQQAANSSLARRLSQAPGSLLGEQGLDITITRIEETTQVREEAHFLGAISSPPGGGLLLPIVWIGLLLSIFQQFVGINVIFYDLNNALAGGRLQRGRLLHHHGDHRGGEHPDHPDRDRLSSWTGSAGNPPAVIGSAGMAVTLATMAVIFGMAGAPRRPAIRCCPARSGPIALIAANLFVVAFGMSWGPVVWVLLGEMFPNRIRAAAWPWAAAVSGSRTGYHRTSRR